MIISKKSLKFYYSIIPISILLILYDQLFYDAYLQGYLPKSPNEYFYFTLIFVLPHIVASLLTFGDKSYFLTYKRKLLIYSTGAMLLTIGLIYFTPRNIYLVIFGLMTLYHVIGQQFGLNAAFSGLRDRYYLIWKFLGFTIAALASVLIFFSAQKNLYLYYAIVFTISILLFTFIVFTYLCITKSKTKFGKDYFLLNFLLILFVFIFILIDYSFFAILLPRVVHDLTAFNFYIVHNKNRTANGESLWPKMKRYTTFWTVSPAILIAFLLNHYKLTFLILFLTLLHYGVESFIWKGKSLHKTYIKF
jgi:hypothetical protein